MNKKFLLLLGYVSFICYPSDRLVMDTHVLMGSRYAMSMVKNKQYKQEDSCFYHCPSKELKGGSLFGVCDGHNDKLNISSYLSKNLPEKFADYLNSFSAKEAYEKAFFDCEDYVLQNYQQGGSTALLVYLNCTNNKLIAHIANLGDSRAIFGTGDKVFFITHDQTLKREDERNRVLDKGGIVYRYANNSLTIASPWRINGLMMTRSIGDRISKGKMNRETTLMRSKPFHNETLYLQLWPGEINSEKITFIAQEKQVSAVPEYTQYELGKGCRWLVLATDGLWDTVSNEEVLSIVQKQYEKNSSLNGVSAKLIEYAIAKGSEDNITVFVVDLLDVYKEYFGH